MATLKLTNVNKVYPNGLHAVHDFNLDINDKEFVVLVGPSGCGKSTTLRMIAGLEEISSGDLYIDDVRVNDLSPKDRGIAMVFQSYALYPHMTVYENLSFGLQLRHLNRMEIRKRVMDACKMLGLETLIDRYPRQLSGGQCQRVALGRAIVQNSPVFLLDEPLSNLDAKLRVSMRGELTKLHRKIGCTSIYVTHDQVEAMTMATKIVIMKDGYVQQVGAPKEVYHNPVNTFVAGFIGQPPMNFIYGRLNSDQSFEAGELKIKLNADKFEAAKAYVGKSLILGIRPEHIYDNRSTEIFEENKNGIFKAKIEISELLGAETNVYTYVGEQAITASVAARADLRSGEEIELAMDLSQVQLFDAETNESITKNLKYY